MAFSFGPGKIGTKLLCAATTVLILTTSNAQEASSTDAVDPDVFNLFLESRTQKPAAQATPQERTGMMIELKDIYLVTNLQKTKELSNDPRTKAQIELQRRAILFSAFATDFLASNPASEQEILEAYETEVAASPPKEYKARHILVESQAQAMALIEELQGGADFVKLATENSTGPSGPSGGDLGWFAAQAMVKPFSEAVDAMEDGAFTKVPVQTQFGWHVILREDSRVSTPPPLESVKDAVKQGVEQRKLQEFVTGLRTTKDN